ncbi:unnamed protein product [Microthlaspi erraticum]|uniref:Uncharacterized protein n=1 Tax=Microthlaspi erraticum TaxID=1685480 RepID=A0A6D2JX94_9BRAS|nr:unnamed protein product [Microthlaspi erraticum]
MMDGLLLSSDGGEDITIMINYSSSKFAGSQYSNSFLPSFGSGVLCAKVSMLLQNVPPLVLIWFLREHRPEWADYGVDAYSAASLRATPSQVTKSFFLSHRHLNMNSFSKWLDLDVMLIAYSPGDMGKRIYDI